MIYNGKYSDIILKQITNDKTSELIENINAHKCILAARSAVLYEKIDQSETPLDYLEINIETAKKMKCFKKLIEYIYTGEILFPTDPIEVFEILMLSHEYKVIDLGVKCEEDIKNKLESWNLLQILLMIYKTESMVSNDLSDRVKSLFQQYYGQIRQLNKDIEENLSSVPGLISDLFIHSNLKNKKRSAPRKSVSFVGISLDDTSDMN